MALDLPADAQVQTVARLTGLENNRPVLLVLTEWNLAIGPLPEEFLSTWPPLQWRRGSLLVVPRDAVAEAQVGERELTLVVAQPRPGGRGQPSQGQADRSTQFVRMPLLAVSPNVRATLDWVVQQSPARTPFTPPPGTPAWGPDPTGQARLRWWDGRTWTGHTRY